MKMLLLHLLLSIESSSTCIPASPTPALVEEDPSGRMGRYRAPAASRLWQKIANLLPQVANTGAMESKLPKWNNGKARFESPPAHNKPLPPPIKPNTPHISRYEMGNDFHNFGGVGGINTLGR